MPYVGVTVSKKLADSQKEQLKAALGQAISLIPGKTQSVLMVAILDGQSLYYAGEAQPDCAFVDVRLKGEAEVAYKKSFAQAASRAVKEIGGVEGQVFMTFSCFEQWGSDGTLTL
nr:hypothetical protein [bacterium]